jgi:hypothetical protein
MTADTWAETKEELDEWKNNDEYKEVIRQTEEVFNNLTRPYESKVEESEETSGKVIAVDFSEGRQWTPKLVK